MTRSKSWAWALGLVWIAGGLASACGDGDGSGFSFTDGGGGGGDGAVTPPTPPGPPPPGDGGGPPPPVNSCAPGCGPTELCGDNGDGNGLDDNCDGRVDEGCRCVSNNTRPCFAGPPDRRGVGTCADGIETCDEFGGWGPCVGGVGMMPELCDGADNDCNGITDDGIGDCTPAVSCPDNDRSAPLSTYALQGGRVYTGAGSGWTWRVECPASVPADLCPSPADPGARDTSIYFTASGAYRVSVQVTTDAGEAASCAWTVVVGGGGLRVELNWDTMQDTRGGTDVDLHLHRWTTNSGGGETNWFGDEDCFYGNCTPSGDINWADHPSSELSNCQDAPHGGGARWRTVGSCRNPRLDVDTNGIDGACRASVTDPNDTAFCAPENVNVDNPILGMPYRVMVNYYSNSGDPFGGGGGAGTTYPSVNIYCGGALRGSFGLDPLVPLINGSSFGASNDSWYVADVVFFQGECALDCFVYPLSAGTVQGAPDPTDPFGFSAVLPFGPAWSCRYDDLTGTCTP